MPFTLTYAAATQPTNGTVVVNANGTYTYTPNANFNGADSFTYTVSDGNGGSVTATISVTVTPVNDAPAAVFDIAIGTEDTAISGDVTPGTPGQDFDTDGGVIAVVDGDGVAGNGLSAVISPVNGSLVLNADGTFVYTPNANFFGSDSFTYRISDGQGGLAEAVVSLTVMPVNDAPVAANGSLTTPFNQTFNGTLPAASDVDGDALTYASGATAPQYGTVIVNANGTYSYVPNTNYSGTDSFTFVVTDGTTSVERTVTVIVTPSNSAPSIAAIAPQTAIDSGVVRFEVGGFVSDVDGDVISYAATGLPPGLSIDPATGIIAGTLPRDASLNGPYTVTLTVADGRGGISSTDFVWSVTNPSPIAQNDNASVTPGSNVVIPVMGNDADPDGDTLSVTSATAANGTVDILADGSIRYTPAVGFFGRDTVSYTISDGNGGTAVATVSIEITDADYVEHGVVFGFDDDQTDVTAKLNPFDIEQDLGANGAVLDAVFDIQSLNSLADLLSAEGIVMAATNGIRSLGGLSSLRSDGAVLDTIRAERAREILFRAGFEASFGQSRLEGLPGFSLRNDVPGNLGGLSAREQIIVESLVRNSTLMLQISNTIEDGTRRIVEYRVTQSDGTPLPKWLNKAGPDFLIGRHDVGVENISLRIEAVYSDGSMFSENVRINATTGEIQKIADHRAENVAPPPMFSDQFRAQPLLTDSQVEGLSRALRN